MTEFDMQQQQQQKAYVRWVIVLQENPFNDKDGKEIWKEIPMKSFKQWQSHKSMPSSQIHIIPEGKEKTSPMPKKNMRIV